jgi:hypothetical protein
MLVQPGKLSQTLILATDNAYTSLQDTSISFFKLFPLDSEQFRARCALTFILEQAGVPKLEGRVCVYYLIACSYEWESIGKFPFLKYFVEV